MLIIIMVMKICVICSAIILMIQRLASGESDFKPEWQRFSLEVVSDKLNLTQAAETCRKHSKSDALSNIAFFYSQQEENFMQQLLTELKKDEKIQKKLKTCDHKFLVGMRKLLGSEWITAEGNFVFGSDFLPNVYGINTQDNDKFCTAIDLKQDFKVIQLACTGNSSWHCFVCEHPCKVNETQNCYDFWDEQEVTNRTEAIEFCQMADVPGELMGIRSTTVLKKLQAAFTDDNDTTSCTEKIAISNLFTLKYESIYEEPMSFDSTRFDINKNTDINKHCVVLDVSKFRWVLTDCREKHCFICKIIEGLQDQPEYPTD